MIPQLSPLCLKETKTFPFELQSGMGATECVQFGNKEISNLKLTYPDEPSRKKYQQKKYHQKKKKKKQKWGWGCKVEKGRLPSSGTKAFLRDGPDSEDYPTIHDVSIKGDTIRDREQLIIHR